MFSIGERRPEPELQLVPLVSVRHDADVGVSLEGEGGLYLAGVAGVAGRAGAVCPVVRLSNEPGGADSFIETLHLLTASQGHRAVLAAKLRSAQTGVVSSEV